MDFSTITHLHKNDLAFLALRKEWLPLAVSFLHYAFKQKHEVLLPQDIFRELLDAYIDHLNSNLTDEDQFRHDAGHYIDIWSRESDLIRIRSRDDGYVVQLSPHAERLIGWFEEMQNSGMIGTESRLRNILSLLDEVVTRSTEDIEKRLQQLYERRDEIDAEINRIEETQQVEGLTDIQIRERLDHISGMASQLLRDFSLVEERFRDMARAIQQAQLDPALRRGDILRTALDADEQLEESDEGQSFRAFYELLTHPEQRESFDGLISAVYDMPRLNTFVAKNAVLQRLTSHLLDAGERVNQSNQRLAEHLRRVVDTRNVIESRRVQTLAQEIKYTVSQLEDAIVPLMSVSTRSPFHTIEGEPDIELPLERPLFDPPEQIKATERPRQASSLIDVEALTALYDTFYIDDTALRENIERLLMSRAEVTLAELVTNYPVEQGMAEVIAYLQIAAQDSRHSIDRAARDTVAIRTRDDDEKQIDVPRIIYRRTYAQAEVNHV
jgi:hypothetical protein